MKFCENCEAPLLGKQQRFCSRKCLGSFCRKKNYRRPEPNGLSCVVCSSPLVGRQESTCSNSCKCSLYYQQNKEDQKKLAYASQRERGLKRKTEFVIQLGSKCSKCGYNKNLAAFVFHHKDDTQKQLSLELRTFSNTSLDTLKREVEKCILLCQNCHMELHYPHLNFT